MKIMSGFYAICAVVSAAVFTYCVCRINRHPRRILLMRKQTMWTKPEYTDLRFGFEVTMYIANR